MSTTTIRMSEALREQVRVAAERAGTTPHGFILQAIAEKAENEALRHEFHETANYRYAQIAASGASISWERMKQHLQQSLEGRRSSRPKAKKLAR